MTKYDYDKYLNISEWVKSGGLCDARVELKYHKIQKRINFEL